MFSYADNIHPLVQGRGDNPGIHQQTLDICEDWEHGSQNYLVTYMYRDAWWMHLIIFCSFLGNTLLLCFIKCNTKLQTHPMKIFMAIAFFDACYFWTLFLDRFMCYL